jgi:hypothetical protein
MTAIFLMLVAAMAMLSLRPLTTVTWFESHDMVAYPVRVMEYVHGWRQGYWYPRWASELYGGYGSPLFSFYPPGVHAPAAALTLFNLTPIVALKYTLLFYSVLGAMGMFLLGYHESKLRGAALLGALVFIFMPYRLTQLYIRGDLAEYCAIALVPFSLWLYRRLMSDQSAPRWLVAATALVHATVIMTHTITGQYYTEVVGLFVLAQIWLCRRRREPFPLVSVATLTASLALAAIYLLPALLEKKFVNVAALTGGKLETANNTVEWIWLASEGFFFMGWPVLIALPAGIVVSLTRKKAVAWTIITAVLVVIMHRHAGPIWSWLPFGRFMMFPWRLLGFVAVFGALMISALWEVAVSPGAHFPRLATAVVAAGLALLGWWAVPAKLTEVNPPVDLLSIKDQLHSTVVFHEYLPEGGVPPSRARNRFIEQHDPTLSVVNSIQSGAGYLVRVEAHATGKLILSNFWFPGWRVQTVEGPAHATLVESASKMLQVNFEVPGTYYIRVQFANTPLRDAATGITLVTLALLGFWVAQPQLLRLWRRFRKTGTA